MHVLITGGCGFVGTNLAERLLEEGRPVLVLDDLSRPGVERNLAWLRAGHGDRLRVEVADIRNPKALRRAVRNACAVFHLAAQVAVTSSMADPVHDFRVNAFGTLNLLEALRALATPPPIFFTSTNKVYGGLDDVFLAETATRWTPADPGIEGIAERPLSPLTPYGCSKASADQYVLDYARTFGLKAVVFRMSCIYGPHQIGTEDQGWVAHFLMRALEGRPITLFGDGKQVRDVLFVDDLVDVFLAAWRRIDQTSGHAFNVGGGPGLSTSLLELLATIPRLTGVQPDVCFASEREGDQRWFVSDTQKLRAATGWMPTVGVEEGLARLHAWLVTARRTAWRGAPASPGL